MCDSEEWYSQDLFKTARSIIVNIPSRFFSVSFTNIQVVHTYSSTDTMTA